MDRPAVETVGDQLAVGREIELDRGLPGRGTGRFVDPRRMRLRREGQTEWRGGAIEQTLAQLDRNAFELGLTAVVKSFHPRNPIIARRRAHTDMKIPPRRERIFEMLRRRGVTAGALPELSVEVGDQMPMLGRIDVGAAGEAEQVLGLDLPVRGP